MAASYTRSKPMKSSAAKATVKKANNSGKDAGSQLSKTLSGFKSQSDTRHPNRGSGS